MSTAMRVMHQTPPHSAAMLDPALQRCNAGIMLGCLQAQEWTTAPSTAAALIIRDHQTRPAPGMQASTEGLLHSLSCPASGGQSHVFKYTVVACHSKLLVRVLGTCIVFVCIQADARRSLRPRRRFDMLKQGAVKALPPVLWVRVH